MLIIHFVHVNKSHNIQISGLYGFNDLFFNLYLFDLSTFVLIL